MMNPNCLDDCLHRTAWGARTIQKVVRLMIETPKASTGSANHLTSLNQLNNGLEVVVSVIWGGFSSRN